MNRFEFALAVSVDQSLSSLPILARELVKAIEVVEHEGQEPQDDPAVLLIGAYISFHTHADINSAMGYRRLLTLCEDRLTFEPTAQ
jgi:hypothetical protein